jgi:hypothetical protein
MAELDDLAARIRAALLDTSAPLWLPELTDDLANVAWRKLNRDLRLTRDSYGTARVLRRDPGERCLVAVSLGNPSLDGPEIDQIPVELLPPELALQCVGPDVRFFDANGIVELGVSARVRDALEILHAVPTVLHTVVALVRALHLIDTADDEFDVSFSDPSLPFSAFISVPGPNADAGALRVAEALLHEAMHLQLSLIEEIVPLVTSNGGAYYSPWRNEYRTAQGVLHALYVFRVIDAFLGMVSFEDPALEPLRCHAVERRATIAEQVHEIYNFRRCTDLTSDGAAFVERLLG